MIAIAKPMLGCEEEEAVHRVLGSGQLAQGENVAAFERRFAEVCQLPEAVAVSSGAAVLHLALLANGIGSVNEVIPPHLASLGPLTSLYRSPLPSSWTSNRIRTH